jgi:glycosyltransferase involved in cell wall biosynthesis
VTAAAPGTPATSGRRAVLLVANPAAPYSRGLRVARSLAAAGFEVEIAALAAAGQPAAEADGPGIATVRYRPTGPWARFDRGAPPRRRTGVRGRIGHVADLVAKFVGWPAHVRGWWRTLERDLPPADLYHAFGILTIPVALRLARSARRQGRRGIVVYDVIDVILESNNVDWMPGPMLALQRRRERRWAAAADVVVTVNEAIAEHLRATWHLARPPLVLLNAQPRWQPSDPPRDPIRAATGIPAERRIVLFLGRLGRDRGLDVAAEAVLAIDDAALVLLGFGPWADRLRERDRDPRFAGRHFTLPPVHPDDLLEWTAAADVSIIAVPANSLNQRLSTPNKFWESLTAGTPMVVGRDLEVMRGIVETERIGATADPLDPADVARALRSILDAPADERAAMRDRARRAALERYAWEASVQPYLASVGALVVGETSPKSETMAR